MMSQQRQGRVFTRLKQYEALPADLQREVESLEQYLTSNQTTIFEKHHPKLIKSVNGIKYKELVEKVDAHLNGNSTLGGVTHGTTPAHQGVQQQPHQHGHATRSTAETNMPQEGAVAPGQTAHHGTATPSTMGDGHIVGTMGIAGAPAPMPMAVPTHSTTHDQSAMAKQEVKAKVTGNAGDLHTTSHASRLIQGLVLKGFITPYNEDDKLTNISARESFEFKDSDLFVPVAAELRGLSVPTTSVWDVAAGAIYANVIKRKANIIEKLKHGSDVYVVVDRRTRTLTVFDDDVSHKAITQLQGGTAQMAEDISYFTQGIKVWTEKVHELFEPSSKTERDVFVGALREIGIKGLDGVGAAAGHGVGHGTHHNVTSGHVDATMHQQGQDQVASTTGAAHGDPAHRLSQEPTMKDKAVHAVDKMTPGQSATHNVNVGVQGVDATYPLDPAFDQSKRGVHGDQTTTQRDHVVAP